MITVPYSLDIAPGEAAAEATAGTDSDVVAGNMKIFLGSAVNPADRQSIYGSLRVVFNYLMTNAGKGSDSSTDTKSARANYLEAGTGNVTLESVTTNIETTDVAIIVSGTFGSERNQTVEYREAFRKLRAQLLERSAAN